MHPKLFASLTLIFACLVFIPAQVTAANKFNLISFSQRMFNALPGGKEVNPLPSNIPILSYHYIQNTPAGLTADQAIYYVSVESLQRQLKSYIGEEYKFVSFLDVWKYQYLNVALPKKPAMVVFTNSYESHFTSALPVLQQLGIKASFAVITDWLNTPGQLTTDQVAQLNKQGMEVIAHTKSHTAMSNLSDAQAWEEINGSAEFVKNLTGKKQFGFVYTSGLITPELENLTKAGRNFVRQRNKHWDCLAKCFKLNLMY